MHWGHAVSRDLVHWEEFDDVLFPDNMGTMFSGSGVVDARNTSGFGTKKNPPLVYAYTTHGQWQKQNIAYSLDHGRTLIKYKGNPVVDSHEAANSHETRDPRLLWYGGEDGHWVMVLFSLLSRRRMACILAFALAVDTKLIHDGLTCCDLEVRIST